MRRRRPLALAAVAAAVAFALLAAGCGGGSTAVASVASSTTTAATLQSGLVGYAQCMRSHGVPTFPDPNGSGGIPKSQVIAARSSDPARFDAASTACRRLLPGGGLGPQESPRQRAARLADGLSFAKCMRSHGVPGFPDPNAQGELPSLATLQAHGVDVHGPAFLHTALRCVPASHGALTAAKVREALSKAGG